MSEGRVALVYPPTCDPTAPYLAVPMLTGFLRAHDVDVLPIDANLEAFDNLLSEPRLQVERDRLELRLAALDRFEVLLQRSTRSSLASCSLPLVRSVLIEGA